MDSGITSILSTFIPEVEGFLPTAKWDNKQWSIGYGTAAGFDKTKRPLKTITRDEALQAAITHFTKDYYLLAPKIHVNLNSNQWCAILSFSYNEGIGNAENLIDDINKESINLESHFKRYVYANGEKLDDLIIRRNKEWNLWSS